MELLIFNQETFEEDGTYTLRDPFLGLKFIFVNALDAKAFVDFYYKNPIAAMFAYKKTFYKR